MYHEIFSSHGREPWGIDALRKDCADDNELKELLNTIQQGLRMLDGATKVELTMSALELVGSERPQSLLYFMRLMNTKDESPAELAAAMGVSRSTVTREWRDKGIELFIPAFAGLMLKEFDPDGQQQEWQCMRRYLERYNERTGGIRT